MDQVDAASGKERSDHAAGVDEEGPLDFPVGHLAPHAVRGTSVCRALGWQNVV